MASAFSRFMFEEESNPNRKVKKSMTINQSNKDASEKKLSLSSLSHKDLKSRKEEKKKKKQK